MILASPEDTERLAAMLLDSLPPGSLLLLDGVMGSGKTTLVSYLAVALGSGAAVSSPTYTLIHEYPSPQGTLVHIDAWRLGSAADLISTGLDDYLDQARLVAVEWGGDLLDHYPGAMLVQLGFTEDGSRFATVGRTP